MASSCSSRRFPRFPRFWWENGKGGKSPFPDSAGNGKRGPGGGGLGIRGSGRQAPAGNPDTRVLTLNTQRRRCPLARSQWQLADSGRTRTLGGYYEHSACQRHLNRAPSCQCSGCAALHCEGAQRPEGAREFKVAPAGISGSTTMGRWPRQDES
jgi:hypothetical protein